MIIIKTTDGKYLGREIPTIPTPGDVIALGDFEFQVQFVKELENKHVAFGNTNYQIECEE